MNGNKTPASIDAAVASEGVVILGTISPAHQNYLATNYDLVALKKQGIVPTGQFTEGGPMFYVMKGGERELTQNPYAHITRP